MRRAFGVGIIGLLLGLRAYPQAVLLRLPFAVSAPAVEVAATASGHWLLRLTAPLEAGASIAYPQAPGKGNASAPQQVPAGAQQIELPAGQAGWVVLSTANGAQWFAWLPSTVPPQLASCRPPVAPDALPAPPHVRKNSVARATVPDTLRVQDTTCQAAVQRLQALGYILPSGRARRLLSTPAARADSAYAAFWAAQYRDAHLRATHRSVWEARYQECNRRFTAGTCGYATDCGMLFLVFGPPDAVTLRPDGQLWHYEALPGSGAAQSFQLMRQAVAPGIFTYQLVRNSEFRYVWFAAVEHWLRQHR